ncbi:hypothetical protein JQ596_15885 [Bradyrhizobium manausense]|uniref:hypothetical protein n=1 Tax=Bradyrhizobium TaxID=374 RepID=UPI001BA981EB|nr:MULTISPECIES: hypothetical protein [Bradyrhizobium]MBR0827025.1 hypothetical protein [Bradyrhizobium manausense]UVO32384.1 hypothetical protein KUF59_18025 [Bradyrhizobium arachidis]
MRAFALVAFLIGLPASALAGDGFEIVVPGRPGVPVIINGIDASYAVIEGEWGLAKNQQVQPTIYGGRYVPDRQPPEVGHYYPTMGLRPGYGRLEVEPPANRKLPQPAQSYYRSWGAQSAPLPAQMDVPVNPPPVILAPEIGGEPRHHRPRPVPHAEAPGRSPR